MPSLRVSFQTLKLFKNLSFDSALLAKMVRIGLIPHMVENLKYQDRRHEMALTILYNMSLSDKVKSILTDTDLVYIVSIIILCHVITGFECYFDLIG